MKVLRADGSKVLEGDFTTSDSDRDGGLKIAIRTHANHTLYGLWLSKSDLLAIDVFRKRHEPKPLDMGQAHINLLHYVLSHGGSISVCDPDWIKSEDERIVKTGLESIQWLIEEIESWDGGQDFYVIEPDDDLDCPGTGKLYWVGMAMGYGNKPNEYVYDYIASPLLNEWFNKFFKEYCND